MPDIDHVLSFATDGDGQLAIHADAKGLELLINRLSRLRQGVLRGDCPHEHLFTQSWGDGDLSERVLKEDGALIHHVKIYGWTAEWVKKHDLAV
jgi:hypothetical protein